jgi:hypothetical protein
VLLAPGAAALRTAGLHRITIGLDTLDAARFPTITRFDALQHWGSSRPCSSARHLKPYQRDAAVIHDLRDAVRSLARTPSLTLTVFATLALGIGSTGAMFGIADRLVLNPLPFADADRLVFLWRANNTAGASGIMTVSGREVAEWRTLRAFEAVEPFSVARVVLTGHGEPRNLTGRSITPGLLPTLKVTPANGRPFDAKDAQPGAEPAVILGNGHSAPAPHASLASLAPRRRLSPWRAERPASCSPPG